MWRPKSSQSAATSCWTSETFASLPLLSSFRPKKPSFPNKMQNVISSEKRTLDHWGTVQVRRFLMSVVQDWLNIRNETFAASFLKMCLCVVALDTMTSSSVSSWINFSWWSSQNCRHPCCLCTFSLPVFCLCFDGWWKKNIWVTVESTTWLWLIVLKMQSIHTV